MVSIELFDEGTAGAALSALCNLLCDSVEDGASVGFLLPANAAEFESYWKKVLAGIKDGTRLLLAAREGDRVIGSVQLELADRPNGRHRAEVQKLLVLRSARRRGVGRALMQAVESIARDHGRSLLVLDTSEGSAAEALYRTLGFIAAGTIPKFARNPDGTLHSTVLFYKLIAAI
jgi:ribosomal protein S18 acetylase RimI-like enzyme